MNIRTKAERLNPESVTIAFASCLLFLMRILGDSSWASPPDFGREMPGLLRGETCVRWIAPYGLATSYRVGPLLRSVRWLEETGHIVKELAGPGVEPRIDYIYDLSNDRMTCYGVNGNRELVVPQKPGPAGCIAGGGDTFIQEYHPVEGQIAVDVYRAGHLVGSVGPFVQYAKVSDVQLANDGSMALLTWKTLKKETVQAVVIGPDGKVRFQTDCAPGAVPRRASPSGHQSNAKWLATTDPVLG
jgi:hypothetical protein